MKPYYQSGGITLYHGDCRDVLPMINGISCVVTSPPYNQLGSRIPKIDTGLWAIIGAGFTRVVNENGYADDMPEEAYQSWQNETLAATVDCCTPTASLFYNHQDRWRNGVLLHPVQWFHPEGWRLRQEIIWNRGRGMMFNAKMFCRWHERILWFDRGRHKWNQTSVGLGTVWTIPPHTQQQGKLHPVEFPYAIPSRCIAATTDLGDVVLDPFAGSGATLQAAYDLGRCAVGIEIEERYCEIAARRLEVVQQEEPLAA